MLYYKIYHYSPKSDLDYIDPIYYGTGLTRGAECKKGKTGLDKSYFYVKDDPEICVKSGANRYEIYLLKDWKNQIYDLATDKDNLYTLIKQNILKRNGGKVEYVYDYLIKDEVEETIKERGYKGFCNTSSSLPHVITLFQKISTKRPKEYQKVLDWNETILNLQSGFFGKTHSENDNIHQTCQTQTKFIVN